MTAVRATPRRSPGMVASFRSGLGGVERRHDVGERDVTGGDELSAAVAQCLREARGPAVLEDEDRGRRTGLEHPRGVFEVAVAEQPRRCTLEDREVEIAVAVDV